MNFSDSPPLKRRDSIVSMINIVFLLLIFFLLTAGVEPEAPFELALPESAAESVPEESHVIFVAADGRIAWRGLEGDAVFPALAAAIADESLPPLLELRADRALAGREVAALLARLGASGVQSVQLIVGRR